MAQLERFKLSAVPWDSDKDPKLYYAWMDNVSSLVRSLNHGPDLEDMIDSKLGRKRASLQGVPNYLLNDPDFAPTNATTATPPEESAEVDDTTSIQVGSASTFLSAAPSQAGSHFTLGSHSVRYADLPDEAKELDRTLYNIIRLNVKGSKQQLLICVTFPSYVQAVLILDKHMNISKMDRIMAAFTAFDKLVYKGNALQFQTEFMSLKRELDRCGADLNYYSLCRLMRAFDGKSKTLQYQIAADFNNMKVDDNLNLFDLVQKYCSEISYVGDGSGKQVLAVNCDHCRSSSHVKADCPKLKELQQHKQRSQQRNTEAKNNNNKKEIVCHHCGKKGHKRPDCRKLKA